MLQIYGTTWTDYLAIKDGVGIFLSRRHFKLRAFLY